MALFLPSSWNEWGGTGLTHMASGLRDHVNPQGAGVSESQGRLREARWAVTAFASGSGSQSDDHPCFTDR